MVMTSGLPFSFNSPIYSIGLFCLLISGCYQPTTPREVTVAFWTAVAENNLSQAQQLTAEKQPLAMHKKLRNAFVQIGKVSIYYDYAEVETQLSLNSAAHSVVFKTFLVRERETDQWLVAYQHTQALMSTGGFQSVFVVLKESGKNLKNQVKEHTKSWLIGMWQAVVGGGKKLKDKLTD